jgi:hypothetical protein
LSVLELPPQHIASHIISKDIDQLGVEWIGVEINASLRILKDFKHASSNSK